MSSSLFALQRDYVNALPHSIVLHAHGLPSGEREREREERD